MGWEEEVARLLRLQRMHRKMARQERMEAGAPGAHQARGGPRGGEHAEVTFRNTLLSRHSQNTQSLALFKERNFLDNAKLNIREFSFNLINDKKNEIGLRVITS